MKHMRFSVAICAVAALAMFATEAQAQRGGGRGGMMRMMMGGGGGQLQSELLVIEEVQGELEMTDEQKEEIVAKAKELYDSFRSEQREIMMGGGDAAEMEELLKEMKEEEKEFVASLNDEQKKRLHQLQIQRMGNGAFQNAKIAKQLGISDEQKKEIKGTFDAAAEKMQEGMAEARESGDFSSMRTIMTDVQTELTKSLMSVMNDDQKSKYEEMCGKKFKFPERQRRRGGARNDF